MKEENFCTLKSPLTGGDMRELQNLRRENSNRLSEGKTERIQHTDHCLSELLSQDAVCMSTTVSGDWS